MDLERNGIMRHLHGSTLAAAVLLAGACASDGIVTPIEPVRPFTAVETQVTAANSAFGLNLLRQLHGTETQANLLVSPLSASMALGMSMNGAVGPTYDAMRSTLGFGGLAEAEINQAYRGLIAQLHARDPKVEFKLANSIWYERTFQVKQPFLDAGRTFFAAEISPLDFMSPSAPRTISRWAEQQTGGRIRDIVERIDPLDKMILINAVYFKAPWTRPFEPNATQPRPFTRADGSTVQVPLMRMDAAHPMLMNEDVHMIELGYADTAFAMVLLAPAPGRSLDALMAGLTPQKWQGWLSQLRRDRVILSVPKFRFEYDIEMRNPLTVLGMGIAFNPREADFTRIANISDLHISKVRQKAFIDVHELGTEAAAATSVFIGPTSMPPELRFDRPFIFAIHERSSGTLLFIGRVGDPSAR
jgi:serine protease inhibitor